MKIQAVIFDWAGTVVDFGSKAPVAAFVAAFEDWGFPVTEAEVRVPMGKAKRDHIASVLTLSEVGARWRASMDQPVDDATIDAIYERFLKLQESVLVENSEVIDGVGDVMNDLARRGIRAGSSTGYTRDLLDQILPLAAEGGFRPEFVTTATQEYAGRPAPWMIYRNCEALNVYPMRAVLKVDDTTVGIEAARNAGCWAVGIAGSGNSMGLDARAYGALPDEEREERLAVVESQLVAAGAHDVLETIADLPACIDKLEARLDAGETP